MLMSTSARIAATPSRICAISRSSGPRTAATMQNSVAPVAAVCRAASTSAGMSSQTPRTGEANSPDWEQKWQSSGQPPVFSDTMPSTSTSGPHQRIRTSWASSSAAGMSSSGRVSTRRMSGSVRPTPVARTAAVAAARLGSGISGMSLPYKQPGAAHRTRRRSLSRSKSAGWHPVGAAPRGGEGEGLT